jgi:hypothetical protein
LSAFAEAIENERKSYTISILDIDNFGDAFDICVRELQEEFRKVFATAISTIVKMLETVGIFCPQMGQSNTNNQAIEVVVKWVKDMEQGLQ